MKTALFGYNLPENLIANEQVYPRDHSRLMVIDRKTKKVESMHFYNIIDYLTENDVLVLNKTKVFPARIFGNKTTAGKVEILLNKNLDHFHWQALAKPGLKVGTKIIFDGFEAKVIKREDEIHIIKFDLKMEDLITKLQKVGITPLPPYIHSKEKEEKIRKKYQTVYAKEIGSVAAPTAGFHFTDELLKKIKSKGVKIEYVILHVGLGTFAPVKTENMEEHTMHSEKFLVDEETIERLNKAKHEGKRIITVGTTSTRLLESLAGSDGVLENKQSGETDIFIYPPYKFKFVDALITNFHLPKSTLLALVSSLVSFPNTKSKFKSFKETIIGKAYQKAIEENFRFYSFGDSMFIN